MDPEPRQCRRARLRPRGSAPRRLERPLGRTQRPTNDLVNLLDVLIDRLSLPAAGIDGLHHLHLERSWHEPEAPVRQPLVSTVKDHRHHGETGGNRQVGEALAERKQPPVAAAGALGPDPKTQPVPADQLRGRGQGRDGRYNARALLLGRTALSSLRARK